MRETSGGLGRGKEIKDGVVALPTPVIPLHHLIFISQLRNQIKRCIMKDKFLDEVKEIFAQSKNWVKLEVEYAKLTLAEKFTILLSTMIIGVVCLLFGMVALILLSLSLAQLFMLFMAPALAYLSVAGVIVLILVTVYLLRKPLLLNPIAKYLTKLILG